MTPFKAGLFALLGAFTFPSTSAAQGPASADAASRAVTLIVDLENGTAVDAERLRAAIARELGVPVVWERGAAGGTLVVRQEGARAVVSFDSPEGRHEGRALPLAAAPEHAEHDIALLAGNVARDQAAPFLRSAAPPPPPPPAENAALADSPRPPAAPAPPPAGPCEAGGPRVAAGADFLPWVGTSTADRGRSIRYGSFGLVGALSGGVRGFALSSVVDVAAGPLCGMQLAGAVDVAGGVAGLQLAGGADIATGDLTGAQVAGAVAVARAVHGAQIAGAATLGSEVHGIQIAGGANVATEDSRGLQIGSVNVSAGVWRGVQIGVLNYAQDADFQLGALNVNASGGVHADVWTEAEMGLLLAGVKNGGRHYHWIYSVGTRPGDLSRPWFSVGFGAHATPTARVSVDFDLLSMSEFVFQEETHALLSQARLVVGYRIVPEVAVFAGPTFNVLEAGKRARPGAPSYATELTDTSSNDYRAWLGAVAGVEVL